MKKFEPGSTASERALQAWLIVIGAAQNRQILTYQGLSRLMFGKDAEGVLSRFLGHIASYCKKDKLPQLNVIVVNKKAGVAGSEIPQFYKDLNKEREKVYEYPWYSLYPPELCELEEAFNITYD